MVGAEVITEAVTVVTVAVAVFGMSASTDESNLEVLLSASWDRF
jgi:hypothetical protein